MRRLERLERGLVRGAPVEQAEHDAQDRVGLLGREGGEFEGSFGQAQREEGGVECIEGRGGGTAKEGGLAGDRGG